jgi:hypothetical protein
MIWSTADLADPFLDGWKDQRSALHLQGRQGQGLTAGDAFFAIIPPSVICLPVTGLPLAFTIFPFTNLAGPTFSLLRAMDLASSSTAFATFGLSNTTFDPEVQYPFPLDSDHPSQTNSPRYPAVKPGGTVLDGVRDGLGRLREDEGIERDEEGIAMMSGEDDLGRLIAEVGA